MVTALIDNDVLHKTIAYGLFDNLLKTNSAQNETYGILGTAKYIVSKKLKKHPPLRGIENTLINLKTALQNLIQIEPTPSEVKEAADLEYKAQHLNLELDNGESILCAVLLSRQLNHILTGDKRAILALETLVTKQGISSLIASKIICLEQIFLWLVNEHNMQNIRTAVCSERLVDKALMSCFSCSSPEVEYDSCVEGLKSYIEHLRQSAPTTLMKDT